MEGLHGEEYSFADVVAKARERCEGRFKEGAVEVMVEGTDWSWEEELALLKEEVGSVADQCRKDETKKMINTIEVCTTLSIVVIWLLPLTSIQHNSVISRSRYRSLLIFLSTNLHRICGMMYCVCSRRRWRRRR